MSDTEDGHWVVEGKSTKFIPMGIKLVKYSDGFENTVESSILYFPSQFYLEKAGAISKFYRNY